MNDPWQKGNEYQQFMGRWSQLIAQKFLPWLAIPPASRWLDVGCGTGSLVNLILETYNPKDITAIDLSAGFIAYAQQVITNPSVRFAVGSAMALGLSSNSVDATVSGLMLNFVPNPETAVSEMMRVTKPGGSIGIFLWDYADGMELLRYFWDAAVALNKKALRFDEGVRFPLCHEGQLETLCQRAGLNQVEARPIEMTTVFQNFDDYWRPFLGEVGPAPGYLMSLNLKERQKLEAKLRESLPTDAKGAISLKVKAWAVKGKA